MNANLQERTERLRGELESMIRTRKWLGSRHVPMADQEARLLEIARSADDAFVLEWHRLFQRQQKLAEQILAVEVQERALAGLQSALDHMAFGAAILDHQQSLVFANSQALATLEKAKSIGLVDGKIEISGAQLGNRINELFQTLVTGTPSPVDMLSVRLESSDDLQSSAVQFSLLDTSMVGVNSLQESRLILMLIVDHSTVVILTQATASRFGLTPREKELLACILEGCDLEEAAEMQSISRNTARNQLSSIFEKTGVKRQSDLVRLAMQFPGK